MSMHYALHMTALAVIGAGTGFLNGLINFPFTPGFLFGAGLSAYFYGFRLIQFRPAVLYVLLTGASWLVAGIPAAFGAMEYFDPTLGLPIPLSEFSLTDEHVRYLLNIGMGLGMLTGLLGSFFLAAISAIVLPFFQSDGLRIATVLMGTAAGSLFFLVYLDLPDNFDRIIIFATWQGLVAACFGYGVAGELSRKPEERKARS